MAKPATWVSERDHDEGMTTVGRSPEYTQGKRAGIKWAITWLHERAKEMNDPHAKEILNTAAFHMGVENRTDNQREPHFCAVAEETQMSLADRLSIRDRIAAILQSADSANVPDGYADKEGARDDISDWGAYCADAIVVGLERAGYVIEKAH